MGNQAELQKRLCAFIDNYGSTISFIARTANINRGQLNMFKLGRLLLEPYQVKRLDIWLSQRGYN